MKRDILELLELYLGNRLPEDVRLVISPVFPSCYDDGFRLTPPGQDIGTLPERRALFPDCAREEIRIEKYLIDQTTIYAGYGKRTRTLMVGKKVGADHRFGHQCNPRGIENGQNI